jgi:thiol-disulfide isomerase/thioredoxin
MRTPLRLRRYLAFLSIAFAICLCAALVGAEHKARSAVSAGQTAPPFQVKTVEGQTIKFPGDYKGKVVLLDFWATWCGPCRRELPNVTATYDQYHSKGFEIISISLDRPHEGPNVVKFAKDNNMRWPQVYDGQYWKAAVAVEYGVHAIPCPVLVDGDTGTILAEGPEALGQRLPRQVEKALESKTKK